MPLLVLVSMFGVLLTFQLMMGSYFFVYVGQVAIEA
jgi:hypothetical protein